MAKYTSSKGKSKGKTATADHCYPENDSKTLWSGTARPVPSPLPSGGGKGGMGKSGIIKSKVNW
jgi:hypothetical protein